MIILRLLLGLVGFSVFAGALLEQQPPGFLGNASLDLQRPKERDTRDDSPPRSRGRPLCSLRSIYNRRYRPREVAPGITVDGNALHPDEVSVAGGNSSHASVHKRAMTLPRSNSNDDMDEFMIRECGQQTNMVWESETDGVVRGVNNAGFLEFPSHGKDGVSAIELAGCTSLVICSHKGVYSGHYWENIGFKLDKHIHGDLYSSQEEAFQKSILDGLKHGATSGSGVVDHRSLSEVADQINDDHIRAFLIIPATGDSSEGIGPPDPYRNAWEEMKKQIGEIIPALADQNNWEEYQYHPVQNEERITRVDPTTGKEEIIFDPLIDTARGKVLVKYEKERGGNKKVRIWAERQELYYEEWS
ncbi:hypothetical protein FQN54_001951 [Arachnomyces sp. PD_36]|nr:hypothetical protein FQN54_001951 [Arachnomyces sp. PD_36]